MLKEYKVKLSDISGKIVTRKERDNVYVLLQTGYKYNKETRHSTTDRVMIGKVCEDDPTMMYPNDNYEDLFSDLNTALLPPAYRSNCLNIGTYVVIQKILEEYHLPDILRSYLGDDTGLFLDLVSFLIIEEENAAQYYSSFAYYHPLFSDKMKIYSDSTVCRFFHSITEDTSLGFLNGWNAERDHSQRLYISYDSTNKNCEAGDIDLLEFGHAKDHKDIPIFNFAIAFDMHNKVPLIYHVYPGSIPDVSEFSTMVDKVKDYGYKRIGFVLDRGYFSKANIQYMDKNHYEFIMMVKGCKELVSSLVETYMGTFESKPDMYIPAYQVFGATTRCRLYSDDTKDRYFHLFFNPLKAASEQLKLMKEIDTKALQLEAHKGKEVVNTKPYEEYFILHYDKNGKLLFAERKNDVIERKLKLCGYFSIITSEKMSAKDAITHYKNRDMSEKFFSQDKTFLGSRSMRVQSDISMKAKAFVEFVALIVRNRIHILLKDEMARMPKKPNYMTVPYAIRELEKIQICKRNNKVYRLENSLTAKQKKILSAFGISESDVKKEANKIGILLESDKSLLDEDEDTEDEYDEWDEYEDLDDGVDIEMEED